MSEKSDKQFEDEIWKDYKPNANLSADALQRRLDYLYSIAKGNGCYVLDIKAYIAKLQQPPPDALEGALLTDDEQAQILETYRDWSDYAKAEAVAQAQLAKATRIIEQRVLDAVRAELLDDYLPRSSESADAFIANAKKRLAGDKG